MVVPTIEATTIRLRGTPATRSDSRVVMGEHPRTRRVFPACPGRVRPRGYSRRGGVVCGVSAGRAGPGVGNRRRALREDAQFHRWRHADLALSHPWVGDVA